MRISIIGAGISGLSAALRLNCLNKENNSGLEITLFEKSGRAGGNISTKIENGIIIEEGADSFITSKPWGVELCRELGIENQLLSTNDTNRKTYIYFDGKLNELPEGFFLMAPSNLEAFKKSPFFSDEGKKRILEEQEVESRKDTGDESLESFVLRRFGRELLDKVAQPLIGGIYTGDPSKLSVKAILPEFAAMEEKQGSVIRGVVEKYGTSEISRKESGARYGLFVSFKEGLSVLINSIICAMPDVKVRFNTGIKTVSKNGDKWSLATDAGEEIESDAVIISGPSYISSGLIQNTDNILSGLLGNISYESSVVINMVFNKHDCPGLPEGFGVVVPHTEKMNIIACSFSSHKFSGRVPDNYEIVRCFLGGAFNPGILKCDDTEITDYALKDLKTLFNIEAGPVKSDIYRYPDSMPQYTIGYLDLLGKIQAQLDNYPTLALSGNAYGGIGIPDSIKSGNDAAQRIFHNLVN